MNILNDILNNETAFIEIRYMLLQMTSQHVNYKLFKLLVIISVIHKLFTPQQKISHRSVSYRPQLKWLLWIHVRRVVNRYGQSRQ